MDRDWLVGPFLKSAESRLPVVGQYVTSYVPRLQDFDRLDECFRLPESAWNLLPLYRDYGFAVFQLPAGTYRVHPMGFEFPRRDPGSLFFPTVHVHDGDVHPVAEFDRALYCQGPPRPTGWKTSFWHPYDHSELWEMDEEKRVFLELNAKVHRVRLRGTLANRDTVVGGVPWR